MTDAPKHGEQPGPDAGIEPTAGSGPVKPAVAPDAVKAAATGGASSGGVPLKPADGTFARLGGATLAVLVAAIVVAIAALYLAFNASGQDAGAAVTALSRQLAALEQRVQALEARPPVSAPAVDTSRLEARIVALEQRPAATGAQGNAGLEARVAELSRAVAAFQATPGAAGADPAALQAATARIAALEQRLSTATDRDAAALRQIEEAAAKLPALSERIGMLARLEQAALALREGRKLGIIPGAPAALSQFADAAPPTDGALRLAFVQAAESVRAVATPPDPSGTFWERSLERMGRLVTVTKGDQVVMGDPAETALARARIALDSGDLAEAVRSAESLGGKQGEAMAVWLRQAREVLAARSALADLLARAS